MKYMNTIIEYDENIIRNSLNHLKTVLRYKTVKCIKEDKFIEDRIINIIIDDNSIYYITETGLKLRSFEFMEI